MNSNATSPTATPTDTAQWISTLWERLRPWTFAAMVGVGLAGAPATDTFCGFASGHIAPLGPLLQGARSPSIEEQLAIYQQAQFEAELAQTLLRRLHSEVDFPLFSRYMSALDNVLDGSSDSPDLNEVQRFSVGLQAARLQLLDAAGSLRVWLRVAQLIAPNAKEHRVPSRFVVWDKPAEAENPIRFDRSRLKAKRWAAAVAGDHGDTAPSHS